MMKVLIAVLSWACLTMAGLAASNNVACASVGVCWHDESWQYPKRWEDVCGVRLTLLAGHNRNVNGLDLGIGLNGVGDRMNGLQVAVLANEVENTMSGLQIAGIGSVSRRVLGVQIAGYGNLGPTQKESYGLQVAGFANSSSLFHTETCAPSVTLCGAQFALIGNGAQRIIGLQCGALNGADQCGGMQVGVFNRAHCLCGLQVGLVNMAKTGRCVQLGLLNSLGADEDQRVLPVFNARF